MFVTNKHVINGDPNAEIEMATHISDGNNGFENCNVSLKPKWYFHPTQDLAFFDIDPLINSIENKMGKKLVSIPLMDDLIPTLDFLEKLSVVEEVIMVGYPNAFIDNAHYFPFFRYGHTSTHPAIDFNNEGKGYVDIAAFPGSSGSPIFIYNHGSYTQNGKVYLGNRICLLGVLSEYAIRNMRGEIKTVVVPTSEKSIVEYTQALNLGYYIKAKYLLDFKDIIDW